MQQWIAYLDNDNLYIHLASGNTDSKKYEIGLMKEILKFHVKSLAGLRMHKLTLLSGVPRGVWGVQPPPPKIPKFWQSRTGLQMERKMFSVPIPTTKLV